jgi:hypothetical protein
MTSPNSLDQPVPQSLSGKVVTPTSPLYQRLRSTFVRRGSPALIFTPSSATEVADAVRYGAAQERPLSIRSGGHGISGNSTNDGGIVIDLAALNSVEVLDHSARLVRVGPGARWGGVSSELAHYGWAISSGDYGGTGVGGLATAGGIGLLVRNYGLTIDHIRGVDIVLATGETVHASPTENTDLFWAVRGAGGNFGVVTAFDFIADEVTDVGFAHLMLQTHDPASFLVRWGDAVQSSPRELTSFMTIGGSSARAVAQVTVVVDSLDPQRITELVQPIAETATPIARSTRIVPYAAIVADPGAEHGALAATVHSALLNDMTIGFATDAVRLLDQGDIGMLQFRSMGGAVADVPSDATAFAHRDADFQAVAMGASPRAEGGWERLRDHFAGTYLSFESNRSPQRVNDAYPPATLTRLRSLKQHYDPDNLFRDAL